MGQQGRQVAGSPRSATDPTTTAGEGRGWAGRVGGWIATWPAGLLAGLLAGAGLVGGLVVYYQRLLGDSQEITTFTATIEYRIWVVLIALQLAMWGALMPGLVRMNLRLRCGLGRKRGWRGLGWQDGCYLALLVVLVVALASVGSTGQPTPPAVAWRTRGLQLLGLIVAMPIFTGVWLLQETVTRLAATVASTPRDQAGAMAWDPTGRRVFAAVVANRAVLQQLLLAASLIIGAATLATGALRLAVLAAHPDASFPPAYALLYGGFFTVVLAFVYVPAHLSLQRLGTGLVDACWPIPLTRPDKDWYDNRQAASAALGLTVSVKDSFQAGAAILAPLVTSVVTVLLPDKAG
jgi:hypothetical protein